ncbi:MAG: TIM barrel protein [Pseudomonadota bacterium]
MRFSANLGFLLTEYALPEAIQAAADAGFDAVECHVPFETPGDVVLGALRETGLPMIGLNTWPGDTDAGDFGLTAIPQRKDEARSAIDLAILYAISIDCHGIHVMAGKTGGPEKAGDEADEVFCENLAYACDLASAHNIKILIEPINTHDVPEYHLSAPDHAAKIISEVSAPNLKMMFDCYHMARMGHDLFETFKRYQGIVGHVQIASVPDRGEPDHGDIDYSTLLPRMAQVGYSGMVGAEYRPSGKTSERLDWLRDFARST